MAIATTVFATASLFSCKSVSNATGKKAKSIVVLYENDVHCAIDGYAKLAGLRDAISDTAYVAVVSSGDFLQGGTAGAISDGKYITDIMKAVGYDAITLGNHEFDYKIPRMFSLLSYLGAPVTCVNLRNMADGQFPFAPYIMKNAGPYKIAFVGATTPTAVETEEYAFFDEDGKQLYQLCPDSTYILVQKAADRARAAGADYVVVLAHLGESKNDTNVDSHGMIQSTDNIDAVLDGHTHSVIPSDKVRNKDGKLVVISETGTKFANIGKLLIQPNGNKSTELIPMESVKQINATVKHVTDSIKALTAGQTSQQICVSDVKLHILDTEGKQEVRKAETNAGDLVADAYRAMTGADFAMTNGGGIRTELPAGTLTYGDIISLLPYNNFICTVGITGQQLLALLNACTQYVPDENGDFPQVSGIKFTINAGKPDGVTDVSILNKQTGEYEPLDLARTYVLATIDYCLTGGGFQGMLKNNKIIEHTTVNYSDCLIRFLTKNLNGHIGNEYAVPQGRITIK